MPVRPVGCTKIRSLRTSLSGERNCNPKKLPLSGVLPSHNFISTIPIYLHPSPLKTPSLSIKYPIKKQPFSKDRFFIPIFLFLSIYNSSNKKESACIKPPVLPILLITNSPAFTPTQRPGVAFTISPILR